MISPQLHAKTPDLTRGEDWRLRGACRKRDPELFFVIDNKDNEEEVQRAKWICRGCSVKDECLAYYMANPDDYAIAGALTPRERRRGGFEHGTTAGYYKHKTRKEPPCPQCRAAMSEKRKAESVAKGGYRDRRTKTCIDCGAPCTRTRCLNCANQPGARTPSAFSLKAAARRQMTIELASLGYSTRSIAEQVGISIKRAQTILNEAQAS
jgi:WhiB family redox-sensing transcriptional regulator